MVPSMCLCGCVYCLPPPACSAVQCSAAHAAANAAARRRRARPLEPLHIAALPTLQPGPLSVLLLAVTASQPAV
jgi:hypothetical protein